MTTQQAVGGKENKVILTIATAIGAAAVFCLVLLLGLMVAQYSSTSGSTAADEAAVASTADTAGAAQVMDVPLATSTTPFVAVKTHDIVYENSNIIPGSTVTFKSNPSSRQVKDAHLFECDTLTQSAAEIKAQGVPHFIVETYCQAGVNSSDLKPKPGTITAMHEYIDPIDASAIVFMHAETAKPLSSSVSVPALLSMTGGDARTTLSQAGLNAKTVTAPSSSAGAGRVIFQSPEPNRLVPSGGTVYIVIAR